MTQIKSANAIVEIQTGNFSTGMYFIKVDEQDGMHLEKFVIQ